MRIFTERQFEIKMTEEISKVREQAEEKHYWYSRIESLEREIYELKNRLDRLEGKYCVPEVEE